MSLSKIQIFKEKDFSNKTLSHSAHYAPSQYEKCSFENANMNSVMFENTHFLKCVFDDCDASNSQFKNCVFENCTFQNASFAQALFMGCVISQNNEGKVNAFLNTGLGNTTFTSSDLNPTKIEGVHFKNNSFRNSIFNGAKLLNVTFEGIPYEKVTFKNCEIDELDLTFGTVKGLNFSNTKIGYFETTAEKSFSIIGLFEVLSSSKFRVCSDTDDGEELFYDDLSDICRILASGIPNLAKAGALYEFLNSVCFLSKAVSSKITIPQSTLPQILNKQGLFRISGDLQKDIELALDWFVHENSQSEIMLNMNSLNYALDVILAQDIINAKIYSQFVSIAKVSLSQYQHPQVSAEVFWKLSMLETAKTDTHYTLTVTDHSVSGINYISSAQLADCLDTFLKISGFPDYRIISRTEGSLIEKIVLNKLDLITNFKQLATVLIIFNFAIEVDLPKYGVHFSYNANSSAAAEKIELSPKAINDLENVCKSLNFNSDLPPEVIKPLFKACQENKEKLSPLNSGKVSLSLVPTKVKELNNQTSSTTFLLPQSGPLVQKALQ
jgi:uncharacterized protein YjbI with pentapeptide repeats